MLKYVTPGTTYAFSPYAVTAAQFRFSGVANVAMADGHVETRRPVQVASIAPFDPTVWSIAAAKYQLGFLVDASSAREYTGD